ncbi:MAG: ribonuclease III [Chloroflexi bacterium]|nr:ribonuclease III [Chloroflexota bacterium]
MTPTARSEFMSRLPANFTDTFLINRALTHRSYLNENRNAIEDNERLEFLGDAILGFLVAEWLYHTFPEKREGFLTKIRAALVHTEQLSDFARQINLGSVIKLGKGEQAAGGADRDAILCDAFEALIAAMYLDTDLDTVKGFVIPMIEREAAKIIENHSEEDVKSRLQEWAQGKGYLSPSYALVSETGPDHDKRFEVKVIINQQEIATGVGANKQMAEKAAAGAALSALNIRN